MAKGTDHEMRNLSSPASQSLNDESKWYVTGFLLVLSNRTFIHTV